MDWSPRKNICCFQLYRPVELKNVLWAFLGKDKKRCCSFMFFFNDGHNSVNMGRLPHRQSGFDNFWLCIFFVVPSDMLSKTVNWASKINEKCYTFYQRSAAKEKVDSNITIECTFSWLPSHKFSSVDFSSWKRSLSFLIGVALPSQPCVFWIFIIWEFVIKETSVSIVSVTILKL